MNYTTSKRYRRGEWVYSLTQWLGGRIVFSLNLTEAEYGNLKASIENPREM